MFKSKKTVYFILMVSPLLFVLPANGAEPENPQSPEAIKRMADKLEAARKEREADRDQKKTQEQEHTPQEQAAGSGPITKQELEKLKQQCETARQKHLAPLKKSAIQECIANKVKTPAECEKFYQDFGEGGLTESGSFRQRRFHNIPECQPYYEAEEKYHKNIK